MTYVVNTNLDVTICDLEIRVRGPNVHLTFRKMRTLFDKVRVVLSSVSFCSQSKDAAGNVSSRAERSEVERSHS